VNNPFSASIEAKLNLVQEGIVNSLSSIESVPVSNAREVLGLLLIHFCRATNDGPICAAKDLILQLPRNWLEATLPEVAPQYLNLDDEWEFGGLLDLCQDLCPTLLPRFVALGRTSQNVGVREAADAFSESKRDDL
jgi:hypothetical protein